MKVNVKYSYIIPTYNRSNTIIETIQSVLEQDRDDYEIIIIDDGSTDNTKEVVTTSISNDKVKYLYKDNGGVSSARNLGVTIAEGLYYIFLDSDDVVDNKQLKVFDKAITDASKIDNSIGVFFSSYKFWYIKNGIENVEERKKLKEGIYSSFFEDFISGVQPFLIGCLCIKANVFSRSNKFKEKCSFGEDQSLWVELACREKLYSINESTFKYRKTDIASLMGAKIEKLPLDVPTLLALIDGLDGPLRKVTRDYIEYRIKTFLFISLKKANIKLLRDVIKNYLTLRSIKR